MKEKITHRVPPGTPESPEPFSVPREHWGAGPWQNEPDRVEWTTSAGLTALVTRSPLTGNLCGYVAVPPGHPLHGTDYEDVDLEAHGGVTYANACQGHICHVPEPGEPDNVWWFGFDCGHAFDVKPAMDAFMERRCPMPASLRAMKTYRDLAYVREECEQLAVQLAAKR